MSGMEEVTAKYLALQREESERPPREKKLNFNISFKGPHLRTLMKLTKATGAENPRQMLLTAMYRYEADLLDQGVIKK